jgi:hypothetical protein
MGVSHLRNLKNLQSGNSNSSSNHTKNADLEKDVTRRIKLATIVHVVDRLLKIFKV